MIVVAEFFFDPTGKRGRFVIKKNSAVLHRWFTLNITARTNEELIVVLHRHVGPPMPWRHADLFIYFLDTVYRTSFVTAGSNQVALSCRGRTRDGVDQE